MECMHGGGADAARTDPAVVITNAAQLWKWTNAANAAETALTKVPAIATETSKTVLANAAAVRKSTNAACAEVDPSSIVRGIAPMTWRAGLVTDSVMEVTCCGVTTSVVTTVTAATA